MGQLMSSEINILALGDSLTEGYYRRGTAFWPYSNLLKTLLRDIVKNKQINIHNYGVSGERTTQIMERFPEILSIAKKAKTKYNIMILLAGTNDMGDRDPGKVIDNLLNLHQMATQAGMLTVAITIPRHKSDEYLPWLTENRKKINDVLRERFVGRVVDLEAGIGLDDVDPEGKSLWDDQLHFSPSGYDRMAQLIYDVVKDHVLALANSPSDPAK